MDRRDRDRYERNDYGRDYDRYEGYNRNDDHYHSARNLTDKFERDYQRERGQYDDDRSRINRSYHEGSMGDDYDNYNRGNRSYRDYSGNQPTDWNRDRNYTSNSSRDRYRSNQDDFGGEQDRFRRDRDRSQDYGNSQQGYSNTDRYNTYNRNDSRGIGSRQDYYTGSSDNDRYSRYNDNTYKGGSSYSGRYGTSDDNRYGSGRSNRNDDSWLDNDRLRREY